MIAQRIGYRADRGGRSGRCRQRDRRAVLLRGEPFQVGGGVFRAFGRVDAERDDPEVTSGGVSFLSFCRVDNARKRIKLDARDAGANTVVFSPSVGVGAQLVEARAYRC